MFGGGDDGDGKGEVRKYHPTPRPIRAHDPKVTRNHENEITIMLLLPLMMMMMHHLRVGFVTHPVPMTTLTSILPGEKSPAEAADGGTRG